MCRRRSIRIASNNTPIIWRSTRIYWREQHFQSTPPSNILSSAIGLDYRMKKGNMFTAEMPFQCSTHIVRSNWACCTEWTMLRYELQYHLENTAYHRRYIILQYCSSWLRYGIPSLMCPVSHLSGKLRNIFVSLELTIVPPLLLLMIFRFDSPILFPWLSFLTRPPAIFRIFNHSRPLTQRNTMHLSFFAIVVKEDSWILHPKILELLSNSNGIFMIIKHRIFRQVTPIS